ncbi:hypothetical protein SAMN04487944_10713 [Gracilibacillus ureilyticus]|uniref:Uncharacterized protein n=2 Tax=Gracilibacillus ureilyticus TaxID=531814 RepID=A0A1H9QKL4_9BACI|nr:hypothetical protein SAMN04487944_10713 [Gracilibacillus ureilyticus]
MEYYYNPEVYFLLINEPVGKDNVKYDENNVPFSSPKIGGRPPYFSNPQYSPYYPVI